MSSNAPVVRASPGHTLEVHLVQNGPVSLDIAFEVAPGKVVALVGPSGSGKTTTLRAIAGLATPERGRIALGDTLWLDTASGIALRPEQRRVGLVFQDYALFPHLSVRGNLELAMLDRGPEQRWAAAQDLLVRVGLVALGEQYPLRLSGGERQRVAIARALARRPEVLLLDEPFSAVDRPTRARLKALIAEVTTGVEVPVVLVTHDIEEATALAQSIVVIDRGRVVAAGPTESLLGDDMSEELVSVLGLPARKPG